MFAPRIHKGPTLTLFGSFTVTSAAGLLIDRDAKHQSPQNPEVVVIPLGKTALTHREFREYVAKVGGQPLRSSLALQENSIMLREMDVSKCPQFA